MEDEVQVEDRSLVYVYADGSEAEVEVHCADASGAYLRATMLESFTYFFVNLEGKFAAGLANKHSDFGHIKESSMPKFLSLLKEYNDRQP